MLGLVKGIDINAYTPPGPTGFYPASECMCSSVLYSLLAGCGVCQGFTFDTYVPASSLPPLPSPSLRYSRIRCRGDAEKSSGSSTQT